MGIKYSSCNNEAEIFHDEEIFVYSVGKKLKKHHKRRGAIVFTDNFVLQIDRWMDRSIDDFGGVLKRDTPLVMKKKINDTNVLIIM
jgi:hypothetical protein